MTAYTALHPTYGSVTAVSGDIALAYIVCTRDARDGADWSRPLWVRSQAMALHNAAAFLAAGRDVLIVATEREDK